MECFYNNKNIILNLDTKEIVFLLIPNVFNHIRRYPLDFKNSMKRKNQIKELFNLFTLVNKQKKQEKFSR